MISFPRNKIEMLKYLKYPFDNYTTNKYLIMSKNIYGEVWKSGCDMDQSLYAVIVLTKIIDDLIIAQLKKYTVNVIKVHLGTVLEVEFQHRRCFVYGSPTSTSEWLVHQSWFKYMIIK